MRTKFNNQLMMLKKSIDWWSEESMKTSLEVNKIGQDFEQGLIEEHEVLDKLTELNNKMDYLYRKGFYEQKNLFDFFSKAPRM